MATVANLRYDVSQLSARLHDLQAQLEKDASQLYQTSDFHLWLYRKDALLTLSQEIERLELDLRTARANLWFESTQ